MPALKDAPEVPPNFELTAASLLDEVDSILASSTSLRDSLVANLSPQTVTFTNFIVPLVDDANLAACRLRILGSVIAAVSPDPALRDSSRQAELRIAAADADNLLRQDIAIRVAAVFERSIADGSLDAQDRYLLSRIHRQYIQSGANLTDESLRTRLKNAQAELNELRVAAQKAFTEAKDGVIFSRTELRGVPESVLATMKLPRTEIHSGSSDDLFWVTYRNDHVTNVMRLASSEATRRKLYVSKQHRFPENVARLTKMITLRDEIARILGFNNHAALRIDDMMAQSVDEVKSTLQELKDTMRPLAQKEASLLSELKKKELRNQQDVEECDDATKLYIWDWAYYSNILKKEHYSVNNAEISEYFEVQHTLTGMLAVFEKLFGMKFEQIVASVWHEDVAVYSVWDDADSGGSFLGYLYIDLLVRDGKYRGAHHLLIRPGFVEASGAWHYPASALICSFSRPSLSRPTLLQHSEVKTMFHELGHAIHNIVSRTKYAIPLSRDFIEVPSIMLENWIWIPDVLVRLGKHFTALEGPHTVVGSDGTSSVKSTLPRELAEDIANTKMLFKARNILAQVQPALFDLEIHTPESHEAAREINTTEVWNRTKRKILVEDFGEGSDCGPGQAQFPHVFRKYDAAYFAYPLSMVYAADLFATGFAEDPLSQDAGKRYRTMVLEPGASQPEAGIIENYLGRSCTPIAILEELSRYHALSIR